MDLAQAAAVIVGNDIDDPRSIGGDIYYVALYSSALSEAEVAANVARLAADDDTAP